MVEIVDDVHYLSIDDLTYINRFLIESQTPDEIIGVMKPAELSSSQARPCQTKYYLQTDDMFVLASVLIESLIQNHTFSNANKRTAMMAGYIFLLLNGYELTAPTDELVTMGLGIACHEYTCQDLENWLCSWSRDYDTSALGNHDKELTMNTLCIQGISIEKLKFD